MNVRLLLFRILVLLSGGLLVTSWFIPWWGCDVTTLAIENAMLVRPYGLENNMGIFTTYIPTGWDEKLPTWFTPAMWLYLGLVIIALLLGIIFDRKDIPILGKKLNISRWLVGIVGFSYIIVAVLAVVVLNMNLKDYGIAMVGEAFLSAGGSTQASWIISHFNTGYYLACIAGPLLMIIAILRNKIRG